LYWGEEAASEAEKRFVSVYQKGETAKDAPTIEISQGENIGYGLVTALAEATGKSKSDIRRLFKQNAASIDGEKVTDVNHMKDIRSGDVIKIGKGTFYKVSMM